MYRIDLNPKILEELERRCRRSGQNETGGVLVGRYGHSGLALISGVLGPPSDSKSGETFFGRGIKGLGAALRRLWKRREHYVGEWHYHPARRPEASSKDLAEMRLIARDTNYQCSSPILIIASTPPWNGAGVAVYVADQDSTRRLHPIPATESGSVAP